MSVALRGSLTVKVAPPLRFSPVMVPPWASTIIASLCIGFLVNAVIVWKFFFAIPLVMAAAITVALGLAFIAAGRRLTSA